MCRKTVQTLCRMCDEHCGISVHLKNNKIVEINGYDKHLWNEGRMCIKGLSSIDMFYAPDRILTPLKKTKSGFKEISLQQALNEISEKMIKIKEKYGTRSLGVWKGEAIGTAQQEQIVRRFCSAWGTPNYFSNDSECFLGRWMGYSLVCGNWTSVDFLNSKCIILWGSNPIYSHPNTAVLIMKAKKHGAKLIVIDSRLSQIAKQADVFVQIKPGTDGALALGICRELINNKLLDYKFIESYTIGFNDFNNYVEDFTPEFVKKETGVNIGVIKKIVKFIGNSIPSVGIYVGVGLEHHENGVNNIRAVACINGLIGSFDAKGGNLIPEPINMNKLTLYDEIHLENLEPIGFDKFPMLYNLRKEAHTMTAMDTILTEKPYPLKGMIITAANPVITNPNSLKVKKALKSLELLVVRDLFMSETAELADYILPSASFLERSELHCHTSIQVVNLTKKVVSIDNCQSEYEFWHEIAHRVGIGKYFPWNNEKELNEWLIKPTGISLKEIEGHSEGLVYKPIVYSKWIEKNHKPFNTISGKIEFIYKHPKDQNYVNELPEYKSPSYITKFNKKYPFVLISGARKLVYYNSRNRNLQPLNKTGQKPEIEIHPLDAKKLGLKNKDMVKVISAVGDINIAVKIVEKGEIMRGVVQVTHGWRNANINEITHDNINDPISGFPLMKSVQVNIVKL